MKEFIELAFDPITCAEEVKEFGELLQSNPALKERDDIQPFLRTRHQLSAFLGSFIPDAFPADVLAYEYPIFGDFAADLVVGNAQTQTYCLIELEDAAPNSIFTKVKGKGTKQWSRRFEHGFSQIIDWFRLFDDVRNTQRFAGDFGQGHCRFSSILIIGRSAGLNEDDRSRLRWRAERVLVNSYPVHCITFDDVFEKLSWRLSHYSDVSSAS